MVAELFKNVHMKCFSAEACQIHSTSSKCGWMSFCFTWRLHSVETTPPPHTHVHIHTGRFLFSSTTYFKCFNYTQLEHSLSRKLHLNSKYLMLTHLICVPAVWKCRQEPWWRTLFCQKSANTNIGTTLCTIQHKHPQTAAGLWMQFFTNSY